MSLSIFADYVKLQLITTLSTTGICSLFFTSNESFIENTGLQEIMNFRHFCVEYSKEFVRQEDNGLSLPSYCSLKSPSTCKLFCFIHNLVSATHSLNLSLLLSCFVKIPKFVELVYKEKENKHQKTSQTINEFKRISHAKTIL